MGGQQGKYSRCAHSSHTNGWSSSPGAYGMESLVKRRYIFGPDVPSFEVAPAQPQAARQISLSRQLLLEPPWSHHRDDPKRLSHCKIWIKDATLTFFLSSLSHCGSHSCLLFTIAQPCLTCKQKFCLLNLANVQNHYGDNNPNP